MAGTSEDTSLEEAQKEIQRRLLRQEKLKRIEEEEMRRLAAMGWQPPRGGPAAHRGPSVHDAADAIEVTERKRRAFAQDALALERQGMAKPFRFFTEWPQEVTGTLKVMPDGRLELAGQPRWIDAEPQEWRLRR